MKIVAIDQFEFENSAAEEFVEIAVARKSRFPFPSVSSFVGARLGVEASLQLPDSLPFDQCAGSQEARDHLQNFAQLSLPQSCSWPTYLFSAGPDEFDLVVCTPEQFIHYRWR